MLSVVDTPKGIYNQIDPPSKNLCRDSAELFLKETIPSLTLTLVCIALVFLFVFVIFYQFLHRVQWTHFTFSLCPLQHLEVPLYVPITCICCVNMNQMMVATKSERILRIRWDGAEERDFSLDLKRIPFSINQQVSYGECGWASLWIISSNYHGWPFSTQNLMSFCIFWKIFL